MTPISSESDPTEVLSAFMDGEDVDPARLAEALSVPDAREILRDFALIRGEVLSDTSRPSPAFYERMGRVLESSAEAKSSRGWWAATVPLPAPLLAAAAVLVLVVGVWMWQSASSTGTRASELPPAPDRVVAFQRGVDWH